MAFAIQRQSVELNLYHFRLFLLSCFKPLILLYLHVALIDVDRLSCVVRPMSAVTKQQNTSHRLISRFPMAFTIKCRVNKATQMALRYWPGNLLYLQPDVVSCADSSNTGYQRAVLCFFGADCTGRLSYVSFVYVQYFVLSESSFCSGYVVLLKGSSVFSFLYTFSLLT